MPDDAWGSTTTGALMNEINALTHERDALRAELEVAEAKDQAMMARLTHYCDLSDALRAEVEKLTHENTSLRNSRAIVAAENERLRTALTEMLESFTEPEDDNDILRRARAALSQS